MCYLIFRCKKFERCGGIISSANMCFCRPGCILAIDLYPLVLTFGASGYSEPSVPEEVVSSLIFFLPEISRRSRAECVSAVLVNLQGLPGFFRFGETEKKLRENSRASIKKRGKTGACKNACPFQLRYKDVSLSESSLDGAARSSVGVAHQIEASSFAARQA